MPATSDCRPAADCHGEQYQSFLRTAHSDALAEADPAEEPPDAEFEHALSGRSYRVYRADGLMRHREWLAISGLEPLVQDYPVKYLIGSGRHTRSYLVEDAGFYTESPLTWYESRKAWALSPGFDRPQHMGFEARRAWGASRAMSVVRKATACMALSFMSRPSAAKRVMAPALCTRNAGERNGKNPVRRAARMLTGRSSTREVYLANWAKRFSPNATCAATPASSFAAAS